MMSTTRHGSWGRIITWTHAGIEWEADARHADLVIEACGIGRSGPKITTPIVKEAASRAEPAHLHSPDLAEDEDEELNVE